MPRVHPEDGRQENPVVGELDTPAKLLRPFPPQIHLAPLPAPGAQHHKQGNARRHSSPSPLVPVGSQDKLDEGDVNLPAVTNRPAALPHDVLSAQGVPPCSEHVVETEDCSAERSRFIAVLNLSAVEVPHVTNHQEAAAEGESLSGRNKLQPRIQKGSPKPNSSKALEKLQSSESNGHNGDAATHEQQKPAGNLEGSAATVEDPRGDTLSPLPQSVRRTPTNGTRRAQLHRQETDSSLTPSLLSQQSPLAKSRWGQAVWYAAQEAERQKSEEVNTPLNQARRASLAALHGEKSTAVKRRQNSCSSLYGSDGNLEDHITTLEHGEHGQLKGLSWSPGPKLNAWKDLFIDMACPFYVIFVFNCYMLAAAPSSIGDDVVVGIKGAIGFLFLLDYVLSTISFEQWVEYLWSWKAALKLVCIACVVPETVWLCARVNLMGDKEVLRDMRDIVQVGAMLAQFIVSWVHLLRTYRAYKMLATPKTRASAEEDMKDGWSMLSSQLTDSVVIHMVIVGMLLLMTGAVLPNMSDAGSHTQQARVAVGMLRSVHRSAAASPGSERRKDEELLEALVLEMERARQPVLFLEVDGATWLGREDMAGRRLMPREVKVVRVQDAQGGPDSRVHLDISHRMRRGYQGQLVVGAMAFLLAAWFIRSLELVLHDLIVRPMERMLITVSKLVRDPLQVLDPLTEAEALLHPETSFIEGALIKVGSLLQLAFGEAGRRIIKRSLGAGATVKTDTKGATVHAIFGFCDIRNFTGLTEVLQADVGKLVNSIASVVHDGVSAHYGAPNKNIGDAFLLVWQPKGQVSLKMVADSALRSYVQIILQLRRSKQIQGWERRPEVQRWNSGFTVKLGYGLHFGWAIECAIGSSKKVDASYLSPHVNLASRLEAATKQYGTKILMSGDIVNLMSEKVRGLVRLLDRVTVKGSEQPMDLYTYDVVDEGGPVVDDKVETEQFWDLAPPSSSVDFRAAHRQAMDAYLGGQDGLYADWPRAKELLAQWPDDGPSAAILNFIDSTAEDDGHCPDWWGGFRPLLEK